MGRVKNFVQNFFQFTKDKPSYASREIICVMGSLASIDPENIFSTIQVLKRHSIRCSVIGLTAEMYACKKLCDSTGGRYDVVMNDNHSREIFDEHMKPVIMPGDTGSDMIPVCFPTREAVFAPPACTCHKDDFSQLDQTFCLSTMWSQLLLDTGRMHRLWDSVLRLFLIPISLAQQQNV
ncbi:General transcription factor IIH subunit [Aphelenchoides besseyi]|nr:General transcription factor IIH subunit [Aphelenchoides besseyi]